MVRKILVTGYGPFGEYNVNPSALIVSALKNVKISDDLELIIKVVDVDYDEAFKISKFACDELDIDFALHFGVHSKKCITLETRSFGDGYSSLDIKGQCPASNRCEVFDLGIVDNNTLSTCISCESLKDCLTSMYDSGIDIKLSDDPGRYLCAYIYYTSLFLLNRRSLFVHIPSIDDNIYTKEVLINVAKIILVRIFEDINKGKGRSADVNTI